MTASPPLDATAPGSAMVCGEALVDLVPADETGLTWQALPGGSPFNTSVALGRLGMPTEFLGRFSDDAFGTSMRLHLARAGVGQKHAVRTAEPSTLAVVTLDAELKAAYTFYWDHTTNAGWQPAELPDLTTGPQPSVLHVGSLAAVLTPAADILYDWFAAQARRVPISYDLNVRPALLADPVAYRAAVTRWLRIATVAKASDDDLEFLYPDTSPEAVVRGWLEQFPQLISGVVTMGSHGALAVERGRPEAIRVPTLRVDVVDTVGAGDTFTAGLLHGLYALGLDLRGALIRAIVAGALVCTRRGAQPPTWLEVDAVVEARAESFAL